MKSIFVWTVLSNTETPTSFPKASALSPMATATTPLVASNCEKKLLGKSRIHKVWCSSDVHEGMWLGSVYVDNKNG